MYPTRTFANSHLDEKHEKGNVKSGEGREYTLLYNHSLHNKGNVPSGVDF